MQQRRLRRRGPRRCKYDNYKVIFKDEIAALYSLSKPRDNHNREKIPVRAYQCTLSPSPIKHWHVTSEKERNVADDRSSFNDEATREQKPEEN